MIEIFSPHPHITFTRERFLKPTGSSFTMDPILLEYCGLSLFSPGTENLHHWNTIFDKLTDRCLSCFVNWSHISKIYQNNEQWQITWSWYWCCSHCWGNLWGWTDQSLRQRQLRWGKQYSSVSQCCRNVNDWSLLSAHQSWNTRNTEILLEFPFKKNEKF